MAGRRSTLPSKWSALADACGGVAVLAKTLEVSPATLFRIGRGQTPTTPEFRKRVAALASEYKLAAPIDPPKTPRKLDAGDAQILKLLGQAVRKKEKIAQSFLDRLSGRLGDDLLITLADTDVHDPDIHLAVSRLLGGL